MKTSIQFLGTLFFLIAAIAGNALADDRIRVVATIPDLADMARHIGGDLVEVKSIATGVEDPHAVPMKPSFATLLNRADVVLLQGLDLEHAFLPGLLDAARNPKIMRDGPGYIDCSTHLVPLEVPSRLDRSLGEQHPLGNPHFNLDPVSGKGAATAIAEGLSRNYPQYESTFKQNLGVYLAELDRWIEKWNVKAAPLKGLKYVSYHPDFIYLARRYGMEEAGTIELRAGIDPTPAHIEELEKSMRDQKVALVIRERHYPAELANTIAEATGAKLVELPIMTNGVAEASDYIHFVDYNISKLVAAATGGN